MTVSLDKARSRLREINAPRLHLDVIDRFTEVYPDAREVSLIRAPGRVNIIGEHTDYNGLPAMPMAIDREIVIAFAPCDDSAVDLVTLDPGYPRSRFTLSGDIPKYETGHWGNYVKAAAQAVWGWAEANQPDALPLQGIRGCVGGNIPPGSGLSSSSALVVASALAISGGLAIERRELADLLAKGERYVGTEGGGMDQAVSLMAEEGSALKIDFFPLRTRPVALPARHVIVVANSLVSANKTGGARLAYNTRVAECRLGLAMLGGRGSRRATSGPPYEGGLQGVELLRDFMLSELRWRDALSGLPDGPMTLAHVARRIGAMEDDLRRKCLTMRDGSLLPEPDSGFQPKKRCRHVLTEGARVEKAAEAAARGDAVELGRLMDESHSSCAEDYEISCPELDELVSILRRSGALGARLTGAGFGGCAIALVNTEKAGALMDGAWRAYYEEYLPARGTVKASDRDHVLFACNPVSAAGPLFP